MRTHDAVGCMPWVIQPEWLPLIASIADRQGVDPEQWRAIPEFQAYDPAQVMARPGRKIDQNRRVLVRDRVGIVPVVGPILPRGNMLAEVSGATSTSSLSQDLELVRQSTEVGAVILDMDTPGGAALGFDELVSSVEALQRVKPLVAFASGACASGGYWLAAAAGEIVASRTSALGSVGVVATLSVQEQPDQEGRVDVDVTSSNAANKRPDPREEAGRAEVRRFLDEIETQFIADVARFRARTPDQVVEDFGRGGIFAGTEAVARGLADRVGTFDETLAGMAGRLSRN